MSEIRTIFRLIPCLLLLVLCQASQADDLPASRPPRGYVCSLASGHMKIDGCLDESAWRSAPWSRDFVDIEGDSKLKPAYRTRVKMLWDDQFLYIGAELEDPHVWATLTEHDSVIFRDPDFEIFIDPDGDNHEYYEIEINALNTEWDLRLVKPYRDGGPALNEWEIPGLQTAVHVNGTLNDPSDRDIGWTVEMAIPWKVLGEFANRAAPPGHGDQWRINFSRVEWDVEVKDGKYVKIPDRPEHNWVWSPQGVIDMHRPERWGYVQFSTGKPGSEKFLRDTTWLARELLMRVYYAERAYKEKHKHWALNVEELGISEPVSLKATDLGWQATVSSKGAGGRPRMLHIRQDSRLWME